MNDLAARFERHVDRSGEHHLWTGATDAARGTGRLKVAGKSVTAHRVAWELEHGPLPDAAKVIACAEHPACVRVDHLRYEEREASAPSDQRTKGRSRKGAGSMRLVRQGVWRLSVTTRSPEGKVLRVERTVTAKTSKLAAELLVALSAEVREAPAPSREASFLNIDDAVERYFEEHLRGERGNEDKTIRDYRALHRKWFSPVIGHRLVRDVNVAAMDALFGAMRRAGLSRSRLNQAKSLYAPFFLWARQRGFTLTSPMVHFKLPTSTYVSAERTPPEVEELSLLLREAMADAPEIAPVLALGAVTGMRRGELVGVRHSRIHWEDQRITVDAAIDGRRLKGTKTRKERTFYVDEATMEMLRDVCARQADLARLEGVTLVDDPFLFSLAVDGSTPMPPDFVTKRVAALKGSLGIEVKQPETIAREDEALRLFRSERAERPAGKTGPTPRGGLSFAEIGRRMERSERWAAMAVAAAERREVAGRRALGLDFDGSILALRKFTSSELLDAGFNISMVAQRQGHGPQVLVKHYSKARRSSDRRAAAHLGAVVHGVPDPSAA